MTDELAVQEGVEETPIEGTAEVQAEEIVEEQLQEEPSDHGERSQLGRKVAEQNSEIKELREMVTNLQSTPRQAEQPYVDSYADNTYGNSPQQQASPQQRDPDEPITWGDIEKHQKEQVQKQQMYESTYSKAVAHFGNDLSQEDYDEVVKLAISPEIQSRVRPSGHPVIDAERHFDKARLAIEQQRLAKYREPQIRSEEAPPRNLGGASNQPADIRQPTAKLSPEALNDPFVKHLQNTGKPDGTAYTETEIANMLKGV